jgi:hypothetical protein
MDKRLREILVGSIMSAVCCLLIGLLFFQENALDRTHYAFQLLSNGIIGGLFFYTLRVAKIKVAVVLLVFLLIVQIAVARSTGFWLILRDILLVSALGSAIYLFFDRYYAKQKAHSMLNPLILGGLLAATNLVATIILVLINGLPIFQAVPSATLNVALGFLSGFGIGLGILISDRAIPRLAT